MRASTKTAISAITFGVLSLTYNIGEQTPLTSHSFSAPTNASSPSATAAQSTPGAPVLTPTPVETSAAKPTTTVPPVVVVKPTVPAVAAAKTVDGSVVQSGYGKVQVQVTKSAGKITDVTMLLANATDGRSAAFSYLIQYAIDANSSNFANLSGATYTSEAFKKSLDAALAKF